MSQDGKNAIDVAFYTKILQALQKLAALSNEVRKGSEWFNFECSFVKYQYGEPKTMTNLTKKWRDRGLVWLAINSTTQSNLKLMSPKPAYTGDVYSLPFGWEWMGGYSRGYPL